METTFAENLGSDNAQEALREREEINHLNEVFGYKPSILENLRELLPHFLEADDKKPAKDTPPPKDTDKQQDADKGYVKRDGGLI